MGGNGYEFNDTTKSEDIAIMLASLGVEKVRCMANCADAWNRMSAIESASYPPINNHFSTSTRRAQNGVLVFTLLFSHLFLIPHRYDYQLHRLIHWQNWS